MRYYILLFLLAFSKLRLALASLYPTHPTADTILSAGQNVTLRWIDTRASPELKDTGPLQIDLCTAHDEFAATLATRVSAMLRVYTVFIPENLTLPGSFVMLFTSKHPPKKFWTANFLIDSLTITDSTLPYAAQLDGANTAHPRITLVLPTTTIVSDLAPTHQFEAATTITAGPLPPGGGAGAGLNRVHSPNSVNPRKGSNFGSARFRLVFILWPALIGISMAL